MIFMNKITILFELENININILNKHKIYFWNYLFSLTGAHWVGLNFKYTFSSFFITKDKKSLWISINSLETIEWLKIWNLININNICFLKIKKILYFPINKISSYLNKFEIKSYGWIILRNKENKRIFENSESIYNFYIQLYRNLSKKYNFEKSYYDFIEPKLIEESLNKIELFFIKENRTLYKNNIYLFSFDFSMKIKENLSSDLISLLNTGLFSGFWEKNKLWFWYAEIKL